MPNCSLNSRASSPIGHPVAHRNRIQADERFEPGHEHRPFDRAPPIGFGRSQTITLMPWLLRRLQAVGHGVDVGVDARADVLQIDDQDVEVPQHLRRRLARLAVERIDRHAPHARRARARVSIMLSCTSDRNPCCGPKMAASLAVGRAAQPIGDVPELAVDRRRIADDADAAAVEPTGRQQPVGSERHRHGHDYRGSRLASDRGPLVDYRALGGLPRLLRPRREPIEPQVRLAPSQ